jgi:hypothetical protein
LGPDGYGLIAREFYRSVTKWQKRFTLETHDIWGLLSGRRRMQCSIICDRIFALLALVHGGDTFRVTYQEQTSSLFWRVGEHFQAWASWMAMESLKRELDISYEEIALGASDPRFLMLYLRPPYVCLSDPSLRQMECQDCTRVKLRAYRGDIIFCTRTPDRDAPNEYTHLVARQSSELVWSDDLNLILVTRSHINNYILSHDALMHSS